jgi:hypothetical protein
LSGTGNFGKKKNNNSNSNFNLHVSSNRTLDDYEEPGYYSLSSEEKIQDIQQNARKYAQEHDRVWFVIVFDGVFTISMYEYDQHHQKVVGGEKIYTCEEFFLAIAKMHYLNVGREIVQFYIQSVDGGYIQSIGHFVIPYDKPSTWIEDKLQMLVLYEVDRV